MYRFERNRELTTVHLCQLLNVYIIKYFTFVLLLKEKYYRERYFNFSKNIEKKKVNPVFPVWE